MVAIYLLRKILQNTKLQILEKIHSDLPKTFSWISRLVQFEDEEPGDIILQLRKITYNNRKSQVKSLILSLL